MAEQYFSYSLAYLIAAPSSALIIGATLNHAYCSKHVSLKFRLGNHAVAILSLVFIGIVFRENYSTILPRSQEVLRTSDAPSVAQVLTPANIGCVQFLIQLYYIQQLVNIFGKSVLTIVTLIVCGMNFLASWGGTISVLIKLSRPTEEVIDLSAPGLPTFQLESPVLAAWLATSLLAELVIVGGNIYARRCAKFPDEDEPIRFLRCEHFLIKIAVATLQTSVLSALLILVASSIFLANKLGGDKPTPGMGGSFILLNLMRIPVGYASLVFSLVRERKLSINAIRKSLMATSNSSFNDFSLEEGKKSTSANQITVHTVTSQVFEK